MGDTHMTQVTEEYGNQEGLIHKIHMRGRTVKVVATVVLMMLFAFSIEQVFVEPGDQFTTTMVLNTLTPPPSGGPANPTVSKCTTEHGYYLFFETYGVARGMWWGTRWAMSKHNDSKKEMFESYMKFRIEHDL